ncbi:MAG: hypothetical protein NTZ85_03500 [Bacteroidia bacterium]|nr:hypothetical protein [Bacteroidia bacterium]
MKKLSYLLIIFGCLLVLPFCKKETSERFKLLTTPVWEADTLLADGVDASGPGQFLENFNGDAKFNDDGTGTFGIYTGTWSFAAGETHIIIFTESLGFYIDCNIIELTSSSLKITTAITNPANYTQIIDIRMTFKAK